MRVALVLSCLLLWGPLARAQDAAMPAAGEDDPERATGGETEVPARPPRLEAELTLQSEPAAEAEPTPEAGVEAEPAPAVQPAPEAESEDQADEDGAFALGVRGGVGLNPDQWVLGPSLTVGFPSAPILRIAFDLLAGYATEHVTLRASLHLEASIEIGDARLYPLVGPSLYHYRPRGRFAEWCDKLQLECAGTALGFEAGVGFGWRALDVAAWFASGELPVLTLSAAVRWSP